MADVVETIAGRATSLNSADSAAVVLRSESSADVLQANSLWQSTNCKMQEKRPDEAKVSDVGGGKGQARFDIKGPEFIGTLSLGSSDRVDLKERAKLVESLDLALKDQKFYAMTDFATPVIILGAALASKYSKPLAIGIGLAAALGNKIYSHEQDLAAGERASQAIRQMPFEDAQRFGKFQYDMNSSRESSQSAYLPFGVYTLASFVPGLKTFFNPAGSLILGAGGLGLDSYHTFSKRPQIYGQFRSEVESWDKQRTNL